MEPSECEIHGSSPSNKVDDAQTITAAESKCYPVALHMYYYYHCNLGATQMVLIGVHASRHAPCRVPFM
jgi:hypothetical protein